MASTVAQAGIAPSKIECCDISLYSSVIGHYLAGTDLSVVPTAKWRWLDQYMTDPLGTVAAVGLAIRILQFETKKPTLFNRERVRELTERADVYIEQFRKAGEQMHSLLGGLSYRAEDMWELLSHHMPNPMGVSPSPADLENTLILCNPPRYTGGYDKMYAGVDEAFDWDRPNVRQFDETQYAPLVNYLGQEGAPKTLVYYATPVLTGEDPADDWGEPWHSVFADRPKTGTTAAINWIVANKVLANERKLRRADVEPGVRAKYKLFRDPEDIITPASDLRVVVEKKEVASYYRDLFVHNLGHLNAERYKVLLVDGKLVATVGLHLQNLRAGGSMNGVAKLRFAFSVDHPLYNKIHKLTLLSVVSSWFWEGELGDIEPTPRAVQTTMLTPHPEAKTARGIFKKTGSERDSETGMFKLTYYADVVDRTPRQTLEYFLNRWANATSTTT